MSIENVKMLFYIDSFTRETQTFENNEARFKIL